VGEKNDFQYESQIESVWGFELPTKLRFDFSGTQKYQLESF